MHTLDQLLSRIVERRGFAVQGADPEALFAKKGDESLLAAWKTDGQVTSTDAQMFLQAYEQVHATSGILVAPLGLDTNAKAALEATKGVEVWAEARLIHEVGDAFVRDAIDPTPASSRAQAPTAPLAPPRFPSAPSPFQASASTQATNRTTSKFPSLVAQAASASVVSNAGAAYFMPSKHKNDVPADMHGNIPQGKGGSLGYAWGGMGNSGGSDPGIAQVRSGRHPSKQVDQWGNLIQPGSPAAAQAQGQGQAQASAVTVAKDEEAYEIISTPKKAPKPASAAAGPAPATNTLKLNVTREQALAATQAKPGAIVRLALVPHVAFEYDLHLERPGIAPVDAKGALLASSLTGELRLVEGLAFASAEPAEARKDQEKLQAVDVYEKVKGHMLKTYSKTMNVEREVAGNTMSETVKIVPDPEEMGLQHRGMVYVPVWEITGGGVNVKVDGFTGQTF